MCGTGSTVESDSVSRGRVAVNNAESIDLGLGLSDTEVDRLVRLVKGGVSVQRSVMYGGEYTSVNWSFSLDDGDESDETVSDAYMQHLLSGA